MPVIVPPSFTSDGCTMFSFLKPLLGSDRYREYCREHDFLRRYSVVPWFKANLILGYRLWQHGLIGKLRAPLYVIATTITWPLYRKTVALPANFTLYADPYRTGRWK